MLGSRKPSLFIGSSSEGLKAAQHLQAALRNDCDATIWDQGVFGLSQETLQNLIKATKQFEFAALVFTPDDKEIKRGKLVRVARDNVIFELGLFIGSLGQERTFIVHCQDDNIDIPTDLISVKRATYPRRGDGNMRASMGLVAVDIREAIEKVQKVHSETKPSLPQKLPDTIVDLCFKLLSKLIKLSPKDIRENDLALFQGFGLITLKQYDNLVKSWQEQKLKSKQPRSSK